MKSLITLALIVGSLNTMASSNNCFKEQLVIAQQNVKSYTFQENVKALNAGIKSCRQMVKREKLEAQIAKLQAKLKG